MIPVPLPLAGNTVYALPLAEGGVLLVDAGPDVEGAWDAAVALLATRGFAPRDVRVVIVTHYHLDHSGLAARWAAHGARVLAGARDVPALAGGRAWYDARTPLRLAALARHGAPPALIDAQAAQAQRGGYGWAPCPEASLEAVRDGAAFPLAIDEPHTYAELRVIAAPGHTPGNLVCHVAATRELYAGDTLLPDTIPTPGLHFLEQQGPALSTNEPSTQLPDGEQARRGPEPRRWDTAPRWPSLPPYLRSVARLRALVDAGAVRRVLPGHGAPVDNVTRLVARFEQHHARRAARVRALLADGGAPQPSPQSAYALARRMFPHLDVHGGDGRGALRLAQATTELIGHLDVLLAAGAVVRSDASGVARYALSGAPR